MLPFYVGSLALGGVLIAAGILLGGDSDTDVDADIDVDVMCRAIAPDRLDEDPLAACHVLFLSPKAAKMRETAPKRGESQSYS